MKNIKLTHFLVGLCLLGASMSAAAQERLSFGVISDVHFENGVGEGAMVKVPKALKNLTSHASLDALAVVGDLADAGRADQYEQLVSVFTDEANFKNPVGKFLFMLGNHDNFSDDGKSNYQEGLKVFNGGEPYPYHQYMVIKGYPFITLSEFSGDTQDTSDPANGTAAYPVDNQRLLAEYLQQAATECPGKPIFIFTHVPPRWSVYGSWPELENGNTWAMRVLNPVLNKYPQAVVFAGHSHYPLGDPRSIHQGANPNSPHENYYTVINTASTTYSEVHPGAVAVGTHPEGYEYVTEGMIVTELENGDLEIRRYDTYRDVEIGADRRWVLKAPFDGTMFEYADVRDSKDNPEGRPLRDGLPAPEWGNGASLAVVPSSYTAMLTIPQATDDECVFRYRMRIIKGGMVQSERFVFSQFYLNTDMPGELHYMLNGLYPSTEYTVEVAAYDSYDNISAPLTVTFTTAQAGDVTTPDGRWTFDDPADLLKSEGGNLVAQPITIGTKSVTVVETTAEAEMTATEGQREGDGAIFIPKFSGLKIVRESDATLTTDYTILMDIKMESANPYNGLFQTNQGNTNDGDLFVYGNRIGMGAMGGYFSNIKDDTWQRIVMLNRGGTVCVYVDGELALSCASQARWEIDPWGFYLFCDEDGEMNDTYVSEVSYWERGLSENEVRALSGLDPVSVEDEPYMNVLTQSVKLVDDLNFSITVDANVPFTFELPNWIEPVDVAPFLGKRAYTFRAQPMDWSGSREDVIVVKGEGVDQQEVMVEQIFVDEGEVPEPLGWWTFDNPSSLMQGMSQSVLSAAFKGADGPEKTNDLASIGIVPIEGPTADNGAIIVPKDAYLWLTTNSQTETLKDYSILYDVKFVDLSGYKSFLQCDMTNKKDAALFVKNNQIGRGGNLGYAGELQTEVWYRVLYVVKEGCPTLYINGEKLSSYGNPVDYLTVTRELLLFADEDGEEGRVDVAGVRFWDMPLSDDMARRLGDVYSDVESVFVLQTSVVRLLDETDFSIVVNTNAPVTFELPDWIEPVDVEPAEGEKAYLFRAKPLEQEGRRTADIIVKAEGHAPEAVSVTQIRLGDSLPEATGIFTFDDASNLMAGTGVATLSAAFKGENGPEKTDDLAAAGIEVIEGPMPGNGAIGVPEDSYLWFSNNLGLPELKDYTLLYDIRPRTLSTPLALYQKSVLNNTDASLFTRRGLVGFGSSGLGYNGDLQFMKWHRVVFVVRAGFATVYIDGEQVGQSTSANNAWTMLSDALFFADDDGEEVFVDVSEIRFWDVPLNAANAKELGAVEQDWEDDPFDEPVSVWTFDDASNILAGTGVAELKPVVHSSGTPVVVETPAEAGIVPVEGPVAGNGAITVPFGSSLQMVPNQETPEQNDFSILMDIRPKSLSGYNALFQSHVNNESDGSLFTKGTGIGLNSNGLGYGGRLVEGKWHRALLVVSGNVMSVFLDGIKVGVASSANTGAWTMRDVCYFFADDNGEEGEVDVAELRYWNVAIFGSQAKALGGVSTETGIQTVREVKHLQQGIYDLQGRLLYRSASQRDKLSRGLYIIDGKVVFIGK